MGFKEKLDRFDSKNNVSMELEKMDDVGKDNTSVREERCEERW